MIPLINSDGELTGRSFRLKDPSLKGIDDMAVQLTLMWDSYRPYNEEPATKTETFNINMFVKNAFENASKIFER
jgi:hypothetical protein